MAERDSLRRYRENLEDERNSAALYEALARAEKNPRLAEVYRRLAQTEQQHAEAWAGRLRAAGQPVPPFAPNWRTRALGWLAGRFGAGSVVPTLVEHEQAGSQSYANQPEAQGLLADEHSHARLLKQIDQSMPGGLEGGLLAQWEGRHRTAGGNALRAAVLGANDGLVSNFSLVMGVAGASLSNGAILVTGLAGLLAGAISMALGEWISVQSSRELYEQQIRTEREELETAPEEEAEELALIYEARGLQPGPAQQLAAQLMRNRDTALEALSRDELGLNPEELGGSPWEAAIASFALFAAGAIIPVLPFTFLRGLPAVAASAAFSAVGLFVIGAAITLFTRRSVLRSGARQVIFGLAAAAVTYGIGRLIGVNVGG